MIVESSHIFIEQSQIQGTAAQLITNIEAVHGTKKQTCVRRPAVKFSQDAGQLIAQQRLSHADLQIFPAFGQIIFKRTQFFPESTTLHPRMEQDALRLSSGPFCALFSQKAGRIIPVPAV